MVSSSASTMPIECGRSAALTPTRYDWKASNWVYDLDRICREFEADKYGEHLNNNFIARRLDELPAATKGILAWGSLLGNSFSFNLVQKLLSKEFDYDDEPRGTGDQPPKNPCVLPNSELDAVAGLQAALQAYVLVPGDDDDQFRYVRFACQRLCLLLFRFAHDRYMQSSASLRECQNVTKMHFLIAETMMKYVSYY